MHSHFPSSFWSIKYTKYSAGIYSDDLMIKKEDKKVKRNLDNLNMYQNNELIP
jgi:hypothetical protein